MKQKRLLTLLVLISIVVSVNLIISTVTFATSQFNWFTCGSCPNPPEVSISGDTITMGIAGRPEYSEQPRSYHGASALLPPANQYIISFDYDLHTWDSYISPSEGGKGYWDSFSVSVSPQPIWQLPLSDPVTPEKLSGLGFIWGGDTWGDGLLRRVSGSRTVVINGDPSGNNYLNVVLITDLLPHADPWFPSWGTITINSVETDSNLDTLGEQAAAVARTVVGGEYLWGGKGWNWNPPKEYVSTQKILNDGYYYYKAATKSIELGEGLDCSGLVYWTYNKVAGTTKYPGIPIFEEGAQGQRDQNTTSISEDELRPGDLLFFSNSPDGTAITHVAMYVGGSNPGQTVVEAANPSLGIIYSDLHERKNDQRFRGFGRVILNQPSFMVESNSPVTLVVTDPDGFTVSSDTYTFTGQEYVRGIPGVLYYGTNDQGHDFVYSPILKSGVYTIQVVPKSDANPNDTFGLNVFGAAKLINLAQDVPISDIPPNGYRISASEFEINPAAHRIYLPFVVNNVSVASLQVETNVILTPRTRN